MKNYKYPLNIQLFADDQGGAEGTPLTFDEILSDKEYQAEFDRRVQKAISTAKANFETTQKEQYKAEIDALKEAHKTELTGLKTELTEVSKNASWEISIAKLGVIDPVALKAHTKEFVEQAEFKDGQIVGFEEHATELLNDKLKYLVPTNKQSLGGKFEQTPPDKTVEDQILSGFGLKE